MALNTHSRFYFGFDIDSTNNAIDFDEGSGEIQATVSVGSYTITEFAAEIETALNAVGGQTYTVSLNRNTRKITISAGSNFSLLISSGSRSGSTAYTLAGFTGADLSGASSYTGDSKSGSEYTTQFKLQDYVPSSDFQRAANAVVNKSVSAQVEVVKFGTEKFIEANFRFLTDRTQGSGSPIRNRPTGVSDFRTFLQFMVTKAPFEFMPDENDQATFEKVILESTPSERDGIGYKLRELVNLGLPGFYESRTLKFRVVET